jgi:hypothetical protein
VFGVVISDFGCVKWRIWWGVLFFFICHGSFSCLSTAGFSFMSGAASGAAVEF